MKSRARCARLGAPVSFFDYAKKTDLRAPAPTLRRGTPELTEPGTIEALRIGESYQTTYGTLWKDGTYFPRGTRVMVAGLHLEQGFCVRFPAEVDGEPLETWEDWSEAEFLAADGTIDGGTDLSAAVLNEAREVLDEAEDGTHLHLHETDD
jgi:hypothetical protein